VGLEPHASGACLCVLVRASVCGAGQVNSTGYHFVRLSTSRHFAYWEEAVAAFNVYVEGAKVLTNLQLNVTQGQAVVEFSVPVMDGQADIELEAGTSGVPVLSGIS